MAGDLRRDHGRRVPHGREGPDPAVQSGLRGILQEALQRADRPRLLEDPARRQGPGRALPPPPGQGIPLPRADDPGQGRAGIRADPGPGLQRIGRIRRGGPHDEGRHRGPNGRAQTAALGRDPSDSQSLRRDPGYDPRHHPFGLRGPRHRGRRHQAPRRG